MGVQKAWKRSTGRGVTVALVDGKPNLKLPEFAGGDIRHGRTPGEVDPTKKEWASESHGTSMLGLIAAQGGESGYMGVAPDARVVSIRKNTTAGLKDLIKTAIDQGADVVNLSLSRFAIVLNTPDVDCDEHALEAAAYAAERDVVLVAAAGNNESGKNVPQDPAFCPGYLAVGGLSEQLTPRKKAVHQDYVAVAAPSEQMVSLHDSGSLYKGDGGTSSAAALTTAAIALIRAAHPDESARQIVSRLLYTAQDVHTPGRDDYTGYGLVRPDLAIDATVPAGFANPVYDRLDARLRQKAEEKEAQENPPEFVVGGDPNVKRRTSSDWEIYGPWLLGAGVLTLAGGISGFLVFRRRRRSDARPS
ncbi:S8 family serine peptidase [Actinocorallia sp. B10E7]|uniref:S8 family serine peptidase n=1 Tax=Actinocorallia sp. B10E7 TaxID=3153558 RepID=UPI00325E5E11